MMLAKFVLFLYSFEMGIIPTQGIVMYDLRAAESKMAIRNALYFDYNSHFVLGGLVKIGGGVTSYCVPSKKCDYCLPFRSDYTISICMVYKCLEFGVVHGCYHPIAPNILVPPLPKIDGSNDRIFIKISNYGQR